MSPSPLQPRRGGGLGGLRFVQLESDGQVQRIAQLACERYNESSEAQRPTGVTRTTLLRVVRLRDGDSTLSTQYPDAAGSGPVVYVVHLAHTFRDAAAQTALRIA